jgi:hypothetical protein
MIADVLTVTIPTAEDLTTVIRMNPLHPLTTGTDGIALTIIAEKRPSFPISPPEGWP